MDAIALVNKWRATLATEASDRMSRRVEPLEFAPRHAKCLWRDREPGHDGRGAGAAAKRAVAQRFMRGLALHFIAHGTTLAATLAFCIHRSIVGMQSYTSRDALRAKLAGPSAFESICQGDTKAKPQVEREGLLQMARKRLAALNK